jgi:hypothetical protein
LGRVRLENKLADSVLNFGIVNRAQQREVLPLAHDGELARWEGHVLSSSVSPSPHAEAD